MQAPAPPCLAPSPGPALVAATHTLRIGYVPLTDAAPLIVADALGLFAAEGVRVALSPERSWATVRDKLAFGALEAAHLLAPMAIAAALGIGGIRRRLTVTADLARNGNTITLSHGLAAAAGEGWPLSPGQFAAAVHARAEDGMPPPTLAVVFAFSSHNYLLRHWLAAGGLDPDHDVRLVVVPPPRVAAALATGAIEGFCAGEPWGSEAVAQSAGRIALTSGDIWPDHPEKVLAFAEGLVERDREAVIGVTAAAIAAQRWLEAPANHDSAVALLRERAFPALSAATIGAALAGFIAPAPGAPPRALATPLRFGAARPSATEAAWWFGAMRRWDHAAADATAAAALAAWQPALWDAAAARASLPAPALFHATPPIQPEESAR